MKREEHGLSRTTEYSSWISMRRRCYDKKRDKYQYYGGRGIRVCKEWRHSFLQFLSDMGNKPTTKHSIDRIDNNGNYEPSNCKWSTQLEQTSNRRDTVNSITFKGERISYRDLAAKYGLNHRTLRDRIVVIGLTPEDAVLGVGVRAYKKKPPRIN